MARCERDRHPPAGEQPDAERRAVAVNAELDPVGGAIFATELIRLTNEIKEADRIAGIGRRSERLAMHALAIRQLRKTYRNGVKALEDIDLTVQRGDSSSTRWLSRSAQPTRRRIRRSKRTRSIPNRTPIRSMSPAVCKN